MKANAAVLFLAASSLVFTGCEEPYGPDHAAGGALAGAGIGAFTGAVIAGARGNPGPGALIGGAIGAVAGGLLGHSIDEREEERLRYEAPQTYVRVERNQPLSLADVKALTDANVSDDVVISQIRNSHSVYHLSANDIIDLQNAGVSQPVINFMINTPATFGGTTVFTPAPAPVPAEVVAEEPPAPRAEIVVAAPGSGYAWLSGEWVWQHHHWVWVSGRWALPPRPHAVWVGGYWQHHTYGWRHIPGHWG